MVVPLDGGAVYGRTVGAIRARRNHTTIDSGPDGTGAGSSSAATGVGPPAVVGLAAAGAQLATFRLGHGFQDTSDAHRADLRWAHGVGTRVVARPGAGSRRHETRRTGLRPLALGWGLLIAGGSVHGRGMAEPLAVVGLDAAGAVVGSSRLVPGGRVKMAGAVAILELPAGVTVPNRAPC